jgi:hypothetical protein
MYTGIDFDVLTVTTTPEAGRSAVIRGAIYLRFTYAKVAAKSAARISLFWKPPQTSTAQILISDNGDRRKVTTTMPSTS